MTKEFGYFLESNVFRANRLFALVYSNQNNNSKRLNTRKYYLPKGIIKNYIIFIRGKNIYDKAIDSDIKQDEEIRKLTTSQGGDVY